MGTDQRSKLAVAPDLIEEALATHVRAGQWNAAAKDAVQLGRFEEAAGYFLEAHQPYDAAVCFQKANRLKDCLDCLLKVQPSDGRYRPACVHAVRLAVSLAEPFERIEPLVEDFLVTLPTSAVEVAAMAQLGQLLVERERWSAAAAVYRRVLAASPGHADALEALARIPDPAAAAPRPEPAPKSDGAAKADAPARAAPGGQSRPPSAAASQARPRTEAQRKRLGDILIAKGKIRRDQLDLVIQSHPETRTADTMLGDALVASKLVDAIDVLKALSEQNGIPYIGEEKLLSQCSEAAMKVLALEQAERFHVMPLAYADKKLVVAMTNPVNIPRVDAIRFATGAKLVTGVFATEEAIRKAIAKFYKGEVEKPPEEPEPVEDWRGKMWDHDGTPPGLADETTAGGARENEFDTGKFEKGAILADIANTDLSMPLPSAPAPAPVASRFTPGMGMPALDPNAIPDPEPQVGQVFAGRYKIETLLGEGGSAIVYKVLDLELESYVAIKLFRPSANTDQLVARFKQELTLSRQLNHPNVVRLFDLGLAGGWRYLTMELLEGEDLATLLSRHPNGMPLREGLSILEQAASGLQAAHDRGVIHRDVKPQNLFITTDHQVKLMDFGIAKKQDARGVTMEGLVMGTPEYMSPEQINGFSSVTALTDLYAMGATAYAIFTGRPPFEAPTIPAILISQVNEVPAPPRQRRAEIPDALDALIMKLLEKEPGRRPQSARDLADAVRMVLNVVPEE